MPNANYPLANEVAKGYSNSTVRPSFCNILVNTLEINILQWILTKLGTYLVLKRIRNPIDFQGHSSKVKVTRSNFYARGYATLCDALVCIGSSKKLNNLYAIFHYFFK